MIFVSVLKLFLLLFLLYSNFELICNDKRKIRLLNSVPAIRKLQKMNLSPAFHVYLCLSHSCRDKSLADAFSLAPVP